MIIKANQINHWHYYLIIDIFLKIYKHLVMSQIKKIHNVIFTGKFHRERFI